MKIEIGHYTSNDNVSLWIEQNGEIYAKITVNLGYKLDDDLAFLDVNNLPEKIIKLLYDEVIIMDTGITQTSGYVDYPMVMINFGNIRDFNKKNYVWEEVTK